MPVSDSNFVKITITTKSEIVMEFFYTEYIHDRLKLLYGIKVREHLIARMLSYELKSIINQIDPELFVSKDECHLPYNDFQRLTEYMEHYIGLYVRDDKKDILMLINEVLTCKRVNGYESFK